jgi:DNA topoisomerase-2
MLAKYQKLTDKEHILKKPDTYLGSIDKNEQTMFIFENNKIIEKNISFIPALFKLFDEGIVNCRDHVVRQQHAISNKQENALPVSKINISIDDEGIITMENDGNGIDVAKHPEHKLWIPEMIFGHLRTSTNYDENKKEKIVGGKNGFGFKLVLIWSTWGKIETIDHTRGLKYIQEFSDNLNIIKEPKITKCKSKPITKVSFKPDYKRFGIKCLSKDVIGLFKKRVYDISAVTDKNVKVSFNNELLSTKNFQQYIDLYIGIKSETPRIYESNNDRWEYAVCLSPNDEFQQISFVNGINTNKGGKHVEYIINQIVRKMSAYIKKKKKVDVKPTSIKEQLMLFLRCDIENPSFNSQTKDELGTSSNNFGSTCNVSDEFIEKLAKLGVMNAACALTEVKQNKAAKKTDGSKNKSIRGIPKLVDANFAGTSKSKDCTIIFCEGDSAKAGIVSGLSKDDRNIIGVYPMKGKLFNTRGETSKKIMENKEITEIKQILGLESNKSYNIQDVHAKLRYGKILFMTDQDLDGSHIKGLGINMFENLWESLIKIPNFMGFMNTPILKAKKGSKELLFYNDGECEKWKKENNTNGWILKYYKGLGTSTSKEFKEYFANKKIVYFEHEGNNSKDCIDKVFNKKRADDRKIWLGDYNRDLYLDTGKENVSYSEFIDRELIHFSKYDCDRSIPNIMDGLKISLRKILFSAFKKNLNKEIKVAQFSGYVSEHSGYHHGEASLNAAIVGMAQDYVGSNNINLLIPNGQFGTRLQGGKDSASERYIFTYLNPITRLIYRQEDDAILEYLDDDGASIEPIYYLPIIPMILINGSKGIGTGFSTDIISYNPISIIKHIQEKLKGKNENNCIIEPYYNGFKGKIIELDENKYLIKGNYEIVKKCVFKITELPIGTWTDDYKQFLETAMDKQSKSYLGIIKDFNDLSTDKNVEIEITLNEEVSTIELIENDKNINGIEKLFKLYTTQSTTNMHMFNHQEKLMKYSNVYNIIDDFYKVRYEKYEIRKKHILNKLEKVQIILDNKVKYILELLNDTLDLRKKTKDEINLILENKKYQKDEESNDYKYLIKMPMDSVSKENVDKLLNEKNNNENKIKLLQAKSVEDIWSEELEELNNYLEK